MKVRKTWRQAALLCLTAAMCGTAGCGRKQEEPLAALEPEGRAEEPAALEGAEEKDRAQGPEGQVLGEPGGATGISEDPSVYVYVCGAVARPGVYKLKEGARIYEAVACAGGLTEEAAAEAVNQAQKLSDGEQIYIPTKEEAVQNPPQASLSQAGGAQTDGKVNINTASQDELTALSGIGESRARSIIAYRESHGAFQSIEELMNVEGIKEGIFQKIKDDIVVGS